MVAAMNELSPSDDVLTSGMVSSADQSSDKTKAEALKFKWRVGAIAGKMWEGYISILERTYGKFFENFGGGASQYGKMMGQSGEPDLTDRFIMRSKIDREKRLYDEQTARDYTTSRDVPGGSNAPGFTIIAREQLDVLKSIDNKIGGDPLLF